MISIEEEKKILELAKLIPQKKITYTKIAKITDISVQTVSMIIRYGKIREKRYQRKQQKRAKYKKFADGKKHKKIIFKPDIPPAPKIFLVSPADYTRCECGRLVIQPCLACWLESHRNR